VRNTLRVVLSVRALSSSPCCLAHSRCLSVAPSRSGSRTLALSNPRFSLSPYLAACSFAQLHRPLPPRAQYARPGRRPHRRRRVRVVKHKNTTIMVHSLSPAMPQAQQGLHSKRSSPTGTAVSIRAGGVTWDVFDLFRCDGAGCSTRSWTRCCPTPCTGRRCPVSWVSSPSQPFMPRCPLPDACVFGATRSGLSGAADALMATQTASRPWRCTMP
jgi:hypothetical protein